MQSTKQAIFKLKDENFGLDIMDVNTIEKLIPMEPVANAPKNVKGMIRLRGEFIPVYSLRCKFGMGDEEPSDDTRLIITTSNGIPMAYEIDQMLEIAQIEQDQLMEAPSIIKGIDTSYIKLVTNYKEHLVILLDHDKIVTEEEQDKIKTIIKGKVVSK
jgi:purine-binding chemotaxis protein CheW